MHAYVRIYKNGLVYIIFQILMSVLVVIMDVIKDVTTQKAHLPALVIMALNYLEMGKYALVS